MQISGRQVVHKGIKISGQNLVKRRVSWFCVNALRRNVGTITSFDDSVERSKEPFDFENDDLHDGRSKTNQLVPLKELFDCHVVEDARSPQDLRAFEIQKVETDLSRQFACDLIGMDELWRVALEALDDGVAARASELMLALSRNLPPKFMCDFLNRIFQEIERAAKSPAAARPPAAQQPPCKRTKLLRGSGCAPVPSCSSQQEARICEARMVSERELVAGGVDGRQSARQMCRFSRALSLLQCLVNAHVVQCQRATLLPHRCCVRGATLSNITLRIVQRKPRQGKPMLQGALLADQQLHSGLDNNTTLSNPLPHQYRRPGNSGSQGNSIPQSSGVFAAQSVECTLNDLHANLRYMSCCGLLFRCFLCSRISRKARLRSR